MSTIIKNFLLLFLNFSLPLVSCASFQVEPISLEPLEQLQSIKPNGKPKDHLFHLLPKKDHENARLFLETLGEEEVTQGVYKFAPGFEGIKLVRVKPVYPVKFGRKDNNFYWRTKHNWGWVALTLAMIGLILSVTLHTWNYRLLKPFVIPKDPVDQRSWLSKIL